MTIRIRLTRQTVKAMQERLHQAYDGADVRLVRRISALVEHLAQPTPIPLPSERWDFTISTFYVWLHEFVVEGLDSLVYHHGGGRPAKLTKNQKKQLCRWIGESRAAGGAA